MEYIPVNKFFICIFVCIASCQIGYPKINYRINEKERLVDESLQTTAKKLFLEKKLYPCGSGGGTMPKIRMLSLSFNYYKKTTLEEARELLVYCVETFLSVVNSNERIHQYLINNPFEVKNIDIAIFFSNPDGSFRESGDLAVAETNNGVFDYKMAGQSFYSNGPRFRETYTEALARLHDLESLPPIAPVFVPPPSDGYVSRTFAQKYAVHCLPQNAAPAEMILLQWPAHRQELWREFNKSIYPGKAWINYIPYQQIPQNYTEHIHIEYEEHSSDHADHRHPMVLVEKQFQNHPFTTYPKGGFSWNIIYPEPSKTSPDMYQEPQDILYEWIFHQSVENHPQEHNLTRLISTEHGLHTITFTRRNREMTNKERAHRIQELQNCVHLVTYEVAQKYPTSLSLIDKFYHSLDLGPMFQQWTPVHTYSGHDGYVKERLIPPGEEDSDYTAENLEIITQSNFSNKTLEELCYLEQTIFKEIYSNDIKFSVLKNIRNAHAEIFYTFSYPQGDLRVTAIARAFLSSHYGYYCIIYRRVLPKDQELSLAECLEWQRRLQAIHVNSPPPGMDSL